MPMGRGNCPITAVSHRPQVQCALGGVDGDTRAAQHLDAAMPNPHVLRTWPGTCALLVGRGMQGGGHAPVLWKREHSSAQ